MDEINLLDYMVTLRNRWKVVAWVTLAALVLCGVYLLVAPRAYQADATLIFPAQQQNPLAGQLSQLTGLSLQLGRDYGMTPGLYSAMLRSRTVNQRVLDKAGLPSGIGWRRLEERLAVEVAKDGSMKITCEAPTSWARPDHGTSREAEAARLAARIVNLYIKELRSIDNETSLAFGRRNRDFIEGELAKTRDELSNAERQLQRFREQNPTAAPPEAVGKEFEQILELKSRQVETESAVREAENRAETVRSALEDESATIVASEVITENPVVADLKKKLAELEVSRDTLLERFTVEHPDVVEQQEQISKIEARLKEEISRLVASETRAVNPVRQDFQEQLIAAEASRNGLEARRTALAMLMERAERRMAAQPRIQIQQMRLLRNLKALEALYTTLLAEYGKARVNEARDYTTFSTLDWAETPRRPSRPRTILTLLIGLVLGLGAGSALAFAQEALFRSTPKGAATRSNL